MIALGSVLLAADDADGDAALGKDGRIGVGEFLFEVAAQLTEVRLGTLCCGLEALELLLAAADADGGAGLMQDGAVALMDLCAHLPVDGGIGCGYTAVPVCRRILLGAALKEPHLDLLTEVGEGVLETAAMLIQRRLRSAAAGDGQGRTEVRDAGAAVVDGDVDVVAAIRETEDDLAAAAVRLDGGDGVVHQLLDGLGRGGVVSSNGLEQGKAAGGVVEHRVADADAGGLIDVLGNHGIIVEEVLNEVGRIHGCYLLIILIYDLSSARSVPRLGAFLRLQSKIDGQSVTEGETVVGFVDAADAADERLAADGLHLLAQSAAGVVKALFRDEHMRRELRALAVRGEGNDGDGIRIALLRDDDDGAAVMPAEAVPCRPHLERPGSLSVHSRFSFVIRK